MSFLAMFDDLDYSDLNILTVQQSKNGGRFDWIMFSNKF